MARVQMLAFCEHMCGFLGEPGWGSPSIAPYTWDPAAAPALWPHCSRRRWSPHRLLLLQSSHQVGGPPGWDCSKLAQEPIRFHDVHTVMRNSYNLVIPQGRKCERLSCHPHCPAIHPSIQSWRWWANPQPKQMPSQRMEGNAPSVASSSGLLFCLNNIL